MRGTGFIAATIAGAAGPPPYALAQGRRCGRGGDGPCPLQ